LNASEFANGPCHPGLPARRLTLTKKRHRVSQWQKNLIFVYNRQLRPCGASRGTPPSTREIL
jgi:hypothetical protein